VHPIPTKLKKAAIRIFFIQVVHNARLGKMIDEFTKIFLTPKMNIAPNLMTHRARGCPFISNVDGEDFVIGGFMKYDGYGDECKELYFAGVAIFQDVEKKLVFPFCFEYS